VAAVLHILTDGHVAPVLAPEEEFARDIREGLTRTHKRIPSKYFYDERGSRLFQQIMALDEYYLTRCEYEILKTHAADISAAIGSAPFNLMELGAGDGYKTDLLIRALQKDKRTFRYVPVDISESALRELTEKLEREYPRLEVQGIVADYFHALRWHAEQGAWRNVVLFLGSSIGNMNQTETRLFLKALRARLKPNDLALIGFDLKKDPAILLPAYSDSKGITAQFNLNVLRRINRELEADFDLNQFFHYETWAPVRGAMESYLLSRRAQTVTIGALGIQVAFEPYEAIHTEYSFKYTPGEIRHYAAEAGFAAAHEYFDTRHYFEDSLWRAI
jgi:dimethylhistidine N-methyltransferase